MPSTTLKALHASPALTLTTRRKQGKGTSEGFLRKHRRSDSLSGVSGEGEWNSGWESRGRGYEERPGSPAGRILRVQMPEHMHTEPGQPDFSQLLT